jgi:isoleucyl-tRNA synthetase
VADELGSYTIKANFASLGPRFGSEMPQIVAAIAALDPAHVARALRDGEHVALSVGGRNHTLTSDDVALSLAPLEGYGLEREGSHAVALELTIDAGLRSEGHAREIVHAIQSARRDAGFEITDRIALDLRGDEALLAAARDHASYIADETLATSVSYSERSRGYVASSQIEGRTLEVRVERAGAEG